MLAASPGAPQQLADEPAPAFFGKVSSQLSTNPGVQVGKPQLRRAPVQVGPESYRFIEFLPAHQQQLTLDLNGVSDVDAVVSALQTARTALEGGCSGGQLRHRDAAPRITKIVYGQPTDALMTAAYRRLYDDKLVGRFDCMLADGTQAWALTTLWDQGEREPNTVISSNQCRFRLESVSPERLTRQQIRFDEFKRKTDALRVKPEPGAGVQVPLDDPPGSVASQNGRPFNPGRLSCFVCGLVVSYRDGVTEVQFGKERLGMPTTSLLPMGTLVTVAELGLYMAAKSPPHGTCLRA
jgi:hypothetical protein